MHIWLIQTGEPLPTDSGSPRLLRTGQLAAELARRGHDVTWWATTFRHATKTQRATRDTQLDVAPNYRIMLVHSPGYTSNVSLRRFMDHRIVGRGFRDWMRREPRPDIIHCAFPAIELAYETARYAAEHDVPWIIDARDMWPDIYVEAVPAPLRALARLLLRPDFRMTRVAFAGATAITGHAPGFVQWGLQHAGRARSKLDVDIPFGYPSVEPDPAAVEQARREWQSLGIGASANQFNICFFGTFAAREAVDLATVIAAARILQLRAPQVRFVLCGAGPSSQRIRSLANGLGNVVLPGWMDVPRIWTLMRVSQLGLLPYLSSRDFAMSIPNKAVEYLSGGLPILTSLKDGYLHGVLQAAGCGRFYTGGNAGSLVEAVLAACSATTQLCEERQAAARLYAARFAEPIVTDTLIDHLLGVVESPTA